jgi:hypothetical protein
MGNINHINQILARRSQDEETSIEGGVASHDGSEVVQLEEVVSIGQQDSIEINEDNAIIVGQSQSPDLRTINGSSTGSKWTRVIADDTSHGIHSDGLDAVSLDEILVGLGEGSEDEGNDVSIGASVANTLGQNQGSDQVVT